VCGDTIAHAGVLLHTTMLPYRAKPCLECFILPFMLMEPFVNHRCGTILGTFLGKASTVGCSGELHECESITPTFNHSTVEASCLVCPSCLASKPKKSHPRLRPPGWWRFRLRQPGGPNCISIRWSISLELPMPILIWTPQSFIFLPFALWRIGCPGNEYWTIECSVINACTLCFLTPLLL
jgi:hypothetical protein